MFIIRTVFLFAFVIRNSSLSSHDIRALALVKLNVCSEGKFMIPLQHAAFQYFPFYSGVILPDTLVLSTATV